MKNNKITQDLMLDEKSYEYLLSQRQDIVFEWDYTDQKIYYSDLYAKKFEPETNEGAFPRTASVSKTVHPDDLQAFYDCYGAYDKGAPSSIVEFRALGLNGVYEWYRSSSTATTDENGKTVKVLGILSNIDLQKKETLLAQSMAMHDGLTGLLNRSASETLITQKLDGSVTNGAMFIVDIDDFKNINDTMGHQFGDSVLIDISEALRALFRNDDIVGRLGGDEFIVFMSGMGENFDIKRRAKDLVAVIKAPFEGTNQMVSVSGSVGIALFPKDGSTFTELYKNADIALYRSKNYGKNRYTLFDANFALTDDGDGRTVTNIERSHSRFKDDLGIAGASDNIIYIADVSNLRVMYLNDAAKKIYGLTDDDLGKKCYQLFHHRSAPCESCLSKDLKYDEFKISQSKNPIVNKTFMIREKLIQWKGITAQISFSTDISAQIDEHNAALLQDEANRILIEAIEKISSATVLQDGIHSALLLLCGFFGGEAVTFVPLPQMTNPVLKGALISAVPDNLLSHNFRHTLSRKLLAEVEKISSSHSGAVSVDLEDGSCAFAHELSFLSALGVRAMLVHSTTVLESNMISAILNPNKNSEYLTILEKTVHFIESEMQKRELTLQINSEVTKYRALLSTMTDSIFEYDIAADELTVHVNDYAQYGLPGAMTVYKKPFVTVPTLFSGNEIIDPRSIEKLNTVFSGELNEPFEFSVLTSIGQEVWMQVRSKKIFDSTGRLVRVSGIFHNVTESHFAPGEWERRRLEHELRYSKGHDPLTGLYNKSRFYDKVQTLLKKNPDGDFTIIRFDISSFKMINELFGMEEGDKLLKYIANCMNITLSAIPNVVYARFEADIFYLFAPHDSKILWEYRHTLEKAAVDYQLDFEIILSYGVYLVEDKSLPIEIMCDRAAIAQSTVKHSYVQRSATYNNTLRERLLSEQRLINDMAAGIENREFTVYYQPQIDLASGKLIGSEALVRWVHPTKGMLSPADFIPVFEKNGFILKLDAYVWETVCRQLSIWQLEGKADIPVSVNVSRVSMYDPLLCNILVELCAKYSVPHPMLKLEIMESSYVGTTDSLIDVTKTLTGAGFTVMMDDFGSGYSSLNMLKDVPVDVLKVDLNFLSVSDSADKGAKILSSVVRMAKWLNMPVVAEGVETQEQANFLRSIGCDTAQGYYFARPMPLEKYESFMESRSNVCDEAADFDTFGKIAMEALSPTDLRLDFFFSALSRLCALMNDCDNSGKVSLQVQTEEQLALARENENAVYLVRSVLEAFPLSISRTMVKDGDVTLLYANSKFFSLYGYTGKTIAALHAARRSSEIARLGADYRQITLNAMAHHLPYANEVEKVLCEDGSIKDVCSSRWFTYESDGATIITCISSEVKCK